MHRNKEHLLTTPASRKVILVVADDNANATYLLQAISQETPYRAFFALDNGAALQFTRHIKPQLFILDDHPPKIDGIELYNQLHAIQELADTPAIIIGDGPKQPEVNSKERQIIGLKKPFELNELIDSIEKSLAQS